MTAQETSEEFNAEVLREHDVFQIAKKVEMKELLANFAQGQIDFYKKVACPLAFFVKVR